MSILKRVCALEKKQPGGAELIYHRIIFEGDNGEADGEWMSATSLDGSQPPATLFRLDDEDAEDFRKRLNDECLKEWAHQYP